MNKVWEIDEGTRVEAKLGAFRKRVTLNNKEVHRGKIKKGGVAFALPDGRKAETAVSSSNIDVSDTARTLAALEEKIASTPVVSEARVEAVRRALDEGRYHVDAQRVADKMMRFESDLLAAIPAHK